MRLFATTDGSGNPIYYANQQDIFAGQRCTFSRYRYFTRRFFKGERVDIWAGYVLADGSVIYK